MTSSVGQTPPPTPRSPRFSTPPPKAPPTPRTPVTPGSPTVSCTGPKNTKLIGPFNFSGLFKDSDIQVTYHGIKLTLKAGVCFRNTSGELVHTSEEGEHLMDICTQHSFGSLSINGTVYDVKTIKDAVNTAKQEDGTIDRELEDHLTQLMTTNDAIIVRSTVLDFGEMGHGGATHS